MRRTCEKRLAPLLLALLLALSLTVPSLAADGKTQADAAAACAAQYGGTQSLEYAVWQDGAVTLTGRAGAYSRTENRALTDDVLYGIGSVSKMYTTAAVLRLAEAGKLSLDAPVTRYLPDFTMADGRYRQITVRMLLNHSSGLMGTSGDSAFLFADDDRSAAETLLQKLSVQRLKADPGAFSVYCNDGFTLAELVVEAVSGKSFPAYLREDLLPAASLTDTYSPGDDFDVSRLARTYADGTDTRALPQETLGIVGAGGLYATASSLASFGGALTGTKLLSASSTAAMAAAEYRRGLWTADDLDLMSYGLGWDSVKTYPFCQSGIQALVKGGDTLRYHAGLVVVPAYRLAVAVVSSGGSSMYNELAAERMAISALAAKGVAVDESVPALPAASAASAVPADVSALAGNYGSSAQQLTASISGTTLTLRSLTYPAAPVQTFSYYADGSFRNAAGTVLLRLERASNGGAYLYQKAFTPVPGLGTLATSNDLAERLPDNAVSPEVQSVWTAAMAQSYLPMNEKYTSQLYQLLASGGDETAGAAAAVVPGYVGSSRIVDAVHALYMPQIPNLAGRDGSDMTLSEQGGVTWLTANTSVYMSVSGAGDIFTDGGWSYSTVGTDGYARWYRVGAAAGRTMSVLVPKTGGFYVYDANGQVTASSVLWGDTKAALPAGGLVVFAGDPGTRFHLRFTAGQ